MKLPSKASFLQDQPHRGWSKVWMFEEFLGVSPLAHHSTYHRMSFVRLRALLTWHPNLPSRGAFHTGTVLPCSHSQYIFHHATDYKFLNHDKFLPASFSFFLLISSVFPRSVRGIFSPFIDSANCSAWILLFHSSVNGASWAFSPLALHAALVLQGESCPCQWEAGTRLPQAEGTLWNS